MHSSPSSLDEKGIDLCSQPTSYSNASSSTFYSRILSNSLRHATGSFIFSRSKKLPNDVEQQSGPTNDDNDNTSIFEASGPDGTKVRRLEACPNGYSRLAAFTSSEQNFMLYRGFSCIHARLLLNLQTSIQMLEAELDAVDRFHNTLEDQRTRLRSWDLDVAECREEKTQGARTRNDIFEELRVKVCQYDELLIKARELVSFQRPTNRDYRSVRNWFHYVAPLVDEEQEYILWKEDIVTLRHGREWAGFDGLVEEVLHRIDCRLVRWLFCTDDQRRKTSDKKVYYFSPTRVSKLVNLCITAVIFLLLISPVLSMYRLSTMKTTKDMFAAIGILMIFTLLFAAAMSLLTKARRHELFAASAAYCAVLVVFIGSTNFD
ncbi:Nn.00g022370.m01.CDS01 [Neocucurbitaria sp. VM-36]